MYENTYSIDTAADILGCTQKKILTEWAKGTIKIVLDFGPDNGIKPKSYTDYDRWGYPAKPWNIANVSAPATNDYFPPELLQPKRKGVKLFPDDDELELVFDNFYHQYSQSGFYFDSDHSNAREHDGGVMVISDVLLYGYWAVPYDEFLRLHVQDSFTLKVCSRNPALAAVTATFTPRGGSRRINAPEKKNLRITESCVSIMRKLLANRPSPQLTQSMSEVSTEQLKSHGGIERFALEREKILAAALYIAHHYPKETGKTFKAHAEAIEKHAYLFWKDEPAPDAGRIAKILSDATRVPKEWKILGGNAKSKK
ncbi:hypothetical protein FNY83_08295 [Salmonella enterica]|nr:hypothetical protein [Salmonella enterica]